ncbi:MAG: hypothetical protein D6767_05225 [Candidatus Hydrogenedentota bacterium]|nr:MAG: hypothetical protein D6767_05225 [Candidatus Hydrogenedentota bacterium]
MGVRLYRHYSKAEKLQAAEEILRDCFWGDYNLTAEQIVQIAEQGTDYDKRFLFGKIIANARNIFITLRIFSEKDLAKLLDSFMIPAFRKEFFEKRINIAKHLLLGRQVNLPQYEWILPKKYQPLWK